MEVEKQTIRLVSPDGTEDLVEVDPGLWDQFTARAQELGVPAQDLFVTALEAFVRGC